MILIGLGGNLTVEPYDSPRQIIDVAVEQMKDRGIVIESLSPYYESEPVPKSDQPWFVNAVARVSTALSPNDLLKVLHDIEENLGRSRRIRWEARLIDLDILSYDDLILPSLDLWAERAKDLSPGEIILPHPRMHERLFVLKPLRDVAPDWRHPVFGEGAEAYIARLEKANAQGLIRQMSEKG